jgi:nucleoid DNA-binding protein
MLRNHNIGTGPKQDIPDELFERLHLTREKAEEAVAKVLEAEVLLRELASQFGH